MSYFAINYWRVFVSSVLFLTLLTASIDGGRKKHNSMGEAFGLLNEMKQNSVVSDDRYRLEALSYQAIYGDWNNPKLMLPIDSLENKLLSQWKLFEG